MRLVIKIGTPTLTNDTPRLYPPLLIELARQTAALQSQGHQIVLVSSGASADILGKTAPTTIFYLS